MTKPSSQTSTRHCWLVASVVLLATLAGCNGPNETAGKEQDKAVAAARGEHYTGSGPNQRLGKAEDRVVAARKKAKDASADALSAKAGQIKRQADVEAATFDEQSKAIKDAADKQADALDEQARAARK